MTINEFLSKFREFFPVEIVRGTAFTFDKKEPFEWSPENVKECFNFQTNKWEDAKDIHVDDTSGLKVAFRETGLFVRFRPPDEKWIYYPIKTSVENVSLETIVPDKAVKSAEWYLKMNPKR